MRFAYTNCTVRSIKSLDNEKHIAGAESVRSESNTSSDSTVIHENFTISYTSTQYDAKSLRVSHSVKILVQIYWA